MKKVLIMVCALAVMAVSAQAQPKKKAPDNDMREKARAAQAALITQELNLTEAESQAFWPVYNDVQDQRRDAYGKMHENYKALHKALKEEADVEKALDAYLDSKALVEKLNNEAVSRYKKVLPTEKVAKLLLAEEKFRHQQINQRGPQGGPQGGGQDYYDADYTVVDDDNK